jgi:LuxR family transcriptional regulator, quorum-sensing system regulator BjaR1
MDLSDAAAFIEGLANHNSSRDVGAAFANWISPGGYLAVSCGESRDTPAGRTWEFFFNTWPSEWLLEYQKNDYVRHDLAPTMARLTARPFTWREAMLGKEKSQAQIEFNQWVASLGVVDGFAVPIHYPGADFGLCVSVADHPIEDPNERLALHAASLYAHQRCCTLGGLTEASSIKAPLTLREIECLRWVLKGKSDTDMAKILGISHTTVHFHIEQVKKKLGVKTRTQAAATILTLGYL